MEHKITIKKLDVEYRSVAFMEMRSADTKWYERYPGDLCGPPTPAQDAIDTLITEMLGKNWYVALPISNDQVNTHVVYEILRKYIDKPREDRKYHIAAMILGFILCFALGVFFGKTH